MPPLRGMRTAHQLIDLTKHSGEHPRMGATDVVPFIPLEGTTMEDCIVLARTLGARVGRELKIPVFLYERAATRPDRENLADVRRGEFEGLRDAMAKNDGNRVPDFGPGSIHPTAGATAIGARPFPRRLQRLPRRQVQRRRSRRTSPRPSAARAAACAT